MSRHGFNTNTSVREAAHDAENSLGLEAAFDEVVNDPSTLRTPLTYGRSVLINTPYPDYTKGGATITPYAVIGVPKDANGESGRLLVGLDNETDQFFVAAPGTVIDKPYRNVGPDSRPDDARVWVVLDFLPVNIGNKVGSRASFGRAGLMKHSYAEDPTKLWTGDVITEEFGPETSRVHAQIEIREDGIVITDTSSNGTVVLGRQPQ